MLTGTTYPLIDVSCSFRPSICPPSSLHPAPDFHSLAFSFPAPLPSTYEPLAGALTPRAQRLHTLESLQIVMCICICIYTRLLAVFRNPSAVSVPWRWWNRPRCVVRRAMLLRSVIVLYLSFPFPRAADVLHSDRYVKHRAFNFCSSRSQLVTTGMLNGCALCMSDTRLHSHCY